MHKAQRITLIAIFLLALTTQTLAEEIPLFTCGNTISTDTSTSIILENNCLKVEFNKIFNPVAHQYDKINDRQFVMILNGFEEVNNANPNQRRQTPLTSLTLIGTLINGDTIQYTSITNLWATITYTLNDNKLKAGATINNYPYFYPDSTLYVETRIVRSQGSTITSTKVNVDGIDKDVEIEDKTQGATLYLRQKLGRGNNIILDPIYTVDYSPIPGQQLVNGIVNQSTDTQFTTTNNITTGLSDSSDATTYETKSYGTQTPITIDYTDGTYEQTDYLGSAGDATAVDFNLGNLNNIESDITVCIRAEQNGVAINRLRINNTVTTTSFPLPTGNNPTTFTCINVTKINFYNGKNRIGIHCQSGCGNPNNRIWISGDTTSPISGNTYDYTLASWTQDNTVDEAIKITYTPKNQSKGIAITGNWNQTYNPQFQYFLRIKKTSTGTANLTTYGYSNNNTIAPTQYKTTNLAGTGWFNINVTSIVNYETNTALLGYTKLRFYTTNSNYFSEALLRKEINDTIPPTITNCQINDTTLGCQETAKLTCNITDNLDVDGVNYTITNLGIKQPTKNGDIYTYIIDPNIDATLLYDWTNIKACDILGTCTNQDPNLNLTYTCNYTQYINIIHTGTNNVDQFNLTQTSVDITWNTTNPSNSTINYGTTSGIYTNTVSNPALVTYHTLHLSSLNSNTTYYYEIKSAVNPNQTLREFNFTTLTACNYVCGNYLPCNTNDTIICTTVNETQGCGTPYNGTPSDFNQACNYCSENLFQILGTCQENFTQTVDWVDFNYPTCCAITGLPSDCTLNTYPYNKTTSQYCAFFNNTMTCEFPNNPIWDARMPFTCQIPQNVAQEQFSCTSQVSKDDETLQINPEQKIITSGLLNIFGREIEERETFTPTNTLLNGYIRDDALQVGTEFTLNINCYSTNTTLFYGQLFTPTYDTYPFITARAIWAGENMTTIIFLALILLVIIAILGILISYWKRHAT